jgi:hypothetical protein
MHYRHNGQLDPYYYAKTGVTVGYLFHSVYQGRNNQGSRSGGRDTGPG